MCVCATTTYAVTLWCSTSVLFVCVCVCVCVHAHAWWVCCPGFNSAVPALSHYHTEQTECVCWVVKLSSALWQSPLSSPTRPPPLASTTTTTPPSPLPLSSACVICRLHTYATDLSGSLFRGHTSLVCVRTHVWRRVKGDSGPCTRRFLKARESVRSGNMRFKVSVCVCVCVCVWERERAADVCRTWQLDNLCVCVPLCTADSNHLNWNEPYLCNFPCDDHGWYKTSPTVLNRVIQEAKVSSLSLKRQKCNMLYLEVLHLLLYMPSKMLVHAQDSGGGNVFFLTL